GASAKGRGRAKPGPTDRARNARPCAQRAPENESEVAEVERSAPARAARARARARARVVATAAGGIELLDVAVSARAAGAAQRRLPAPVAHRVPVAAPGVVVVVAPLAAHVVIAVLADRVAEVATATRRRRHAGDEL